MSLEVASVREDRACTTVNTGCKILSFFEWAVWVWCYTPSVLVVSSCSIILTSKGIEIILQNTLVVFLELYRELQNRQQPQIPLPSSTKKRKALI